MNKIEADSLLSKIKDLELVERLRFLSDKYSDRIVFSTSLGMEDQVITDLIFGNNLQIEVFTIDTGRLFPETYEVLNKTIKKYGKTIRVYFPDYKLVEPMISRKGVFSFYHSVDNRKECCYIRKVEPLKRALRGKDVWITGLRKEQSVEREKTGEIEWDIENNLVKYNPLFDWSLNDVKSYLTENNIAYNVLHDKGFISIGCAPCTRAVKEGESEREGRWWWENSGKKECGLHVNDRQGKMNKR